MSSNTSNFDFLKKEFLGLLDACRKAEQNGLKDPRTSCFYARRALEKTIEWQYQHDKRLNDPYDNNLAAMLQEASYKKLLRPELKPKVEIIRKLGNMAVHSNKPIRQYDALQCCKELYHFMFWIARVYNRLGRENYPVVEWNQDLIPTGDTPSRTKASQMKSLEKSLSDKDNELAEAQKANESIQEELEKLRAQITEVTKQNEIQPETLDYSEDETRKYLIDLLLREAGWDIPKEDKEEKVAGMPNNAGVGYVDYILRGKDGKPLGLVEAKRASVDPKVGQQQAKLYADCLEKKYGLRPIIFYSNGYQHYIWDDKDYPPRMVSGFYNRSELELLIKRRSDRKELKIADIDNDIAGRYYQKESIQRISEHFKAKHRRSLIVMATGTGKTRLAIALVDLLQRNNWAKRVLFLADRVALVNQAKKAFKAQLPSSQPVSLIEDKNTESRVVLSTYPTMMGMLNEFKEDGTRKFNIGHFDLIIVDEAHRSIYLKYKAIFQYFDSLLLGLTATPKSEVDRNTYELFEVENGVPTYAYELDKAVDDEYLVPPKAVSVGMKFQRSGIHYDDLSEKEQEQWDLLEFEDTEQEAFNAIQDKDRKVVDPNKLDQFLFNKNTTDQMLKQLMTEGLRVDGATKLGKTIIFAKNHKHAEFIQERFNSCFPNLVGSFARIIDNQVKYAQSLIEDFSVVEKDPQIAISVDMMDTGIDVPEAVNLVFYKVVCSRTKFFQMIGRGTRLCPDLFGPEHDKEYFLIFDYCGNFEFFKQNPQGNEGNSGDPLDKRNFRYRVEILRHLKSKEVNPELLEDAPATYQGKVDLESDLTTLLHSQVSGMDHENILVRPHWEHVERFQAKENWLELDDEAYGNLNRQVAGLPTTEDMGIIEAQYFDSLILKGQLSILERNANIVQVKKRIIEIASKLQEKSSIPQVKDNLELIIDLQTEEYWQDVTIEMLEEVRKKLRNLIKLIDKKNRKIVITNFEDEFQSMEEIDVAGLTEVIDKKQYKKRVQKYLKDHLDHIVLKKLHYNEPLTKLDLEELERFLFDATELGDREQFEGCYGKQDNLPLFIRGIIGLDRNAAKEAFTKYLDSNQFNANQIDFINLVIDNLSQNGIIEPKSLAQEMPFTSISEKGILGVFPMDQAQKVIAIVRDFQSVQV